MTDTLAPAESRDADRPKRTTSAMADGLVGSEILAIAAQIRALKAEGATLCNLTVGDFDPAEFRIPKRLEELITEALARGETNYPPSEGLMPLRESVIAFYKRRLGLSVKPASVIITGGSRPGIYATYRTLVDPGDRVVYPVPSWNNNHYCHMSGAVGVPITCGADTNFLPTAKMLERPLRGARVLALNSPLNPAGTAFDAQQLGAICDLVLAENQRRGDGEPLLYVMYDQVYWTLTFGQTKHVDPVSLRPEMEKYTVYVDGISKAFAATGVRVGWVVAPPIIAQRMSGLLGHMGAWAPRAEQVATAKFLGEDEAVQAFHEEFTHGLQQRLDALHAGITALKNEGFDLEAFTPMGAIYLSARFGLFGKRTPAGETLSTNEEIRRYLLKSSGLCVVPFQAFGVAEDTGWFRLSVGAVSVAEIEGVLPRLRAALAALT
jgi:aspartate aminotransferase